ncbi:ankyrin repeat domain-containing protein [Aspergillus thermomutatus]|uniref:Uncharacterized protein n=1 Tax=Aspergillus thermomutatus TaxID=41047 RepID=A0A397FZW4_ASPTH|nr:uncharacterized protein CDV56_102814 [Aspergillus thermomutatus]RHZ44332.1 hypothetical protein CDV56_102814 [Aspergillus thermomutatus]
MGTIAMSIPPDSKTVIDGEFRRMKNIREIRLSDDIKAFVNNAHSLFELKGASNHRGPCKRSLIHYVAVGDCPELLRCLLRTGAAKDVRDQNKHTPLSWAAEYGALDSVKILLEYGAKINSMDDMYSTPLSWSIHVPHSLGGPGEAFRIIKEERQGQDPARNFKQDLQYPIPLIRIRNIREERSFRRSPYTSDGRSQRYRHKRTGAEVAGCQLVERQSDALIDFEMGRLQVEDDTVLGPSCSDDDGQEVRSVEAMYPQFEHQEAEG